MAKHKKLIIWIVVILAIIIGGVFYLKSQKPKTQYTTAEVSRNNLFQTVSVTGTLNPEKSYDLAFKTSGRISQISVKVGDMVEKGQRVAQIDIGSLYSQLREAEAAVKVQKETLYNIKRRKSTYNREQINAQRAEVTSAQEATNAIRDQIRDTVLYSPVSGLVIRRNVDEGEVTIANSSGTSIVVTVAPEGDLIIESNVPESDIVKIKIGQKAELTFDALMPDEKINAEIFEIDPASTVIQDVVYYQIKLRLSKQDARLKVGMSNNIDIRTAEKNNALIIPLRAVQTENGQKIVQVMVDEKNNVIEKRKVETGLEGDEGMVEVISGLQSGEKVITFTKTL